MDKSQIVSQYENGIKITNLAKMNNVTRQYIEQIIRPLKHSCRQKVIYAIEHGQIQRQPCTICGDINSQAHHNDYSKPFEITWLCMKHHKEIHKNVKYSIPPKLQSELLITRGYSLTLGEMLILETKARSMGDSSLSAAIRAIIREWAVANSQRVAITEAGRQTLAAAEAENSTAK